MQSVRRNTGPNALRRGRVSIAGANYFVTVCVEPRRPILRSRVATHVLAECHLLHTDGSWSLRCMTVMPDHVHLFFTLGNRLTLSQVIARLKAKTRPLFRASQVDWQDNYYDHRLRPEDPVECVIRYIWLNPYLAGLISRDQSWPAFNCCGDDWRWFAPLADNNQPFPEWLT